MNTKEALDTIEARMTSIQPNGKNLTVKVRTLQSQLDESHKVSELQQELAKELEKPEAVAKLRNYKEALDRAAAATTQFSDEMSKLPKEAEKAIAQLSGALQASDFDNVQKKSLQRHTPLKTVGISARWPKLRATKLAIAIHAALLYFPADQFTTKKVRK